MSIFAEAMEVMTEFINDEGQDVTIIHPSGTENTFKCLANDIHLVIDPLTSEAITGRQSTISVSLTDLTTVGFEDIGAVSFSDLKPWVVKLADSVGVERTFKIMETYPDKTLGVSVLFLENYEEL